jgi:hypothetical protein
MVDEHRHERPVELLTLRGSVRGLLLTTPHRRTLDDLNVAARSFLTLLRPEFAGSPWLPDKETLAVNRASILLVRELGVPPVQSAQHSLRFTRAPLELCVGDYTVHGFIHVPPAGHAMKRLDQDPHLFFALTEALVTGPQVELVCPFVAINRSFVWAVQLTAQSESVAEIEATTTSV